MTPKEAYKRGEDYFFNGANDYNCRFSIFATPENTKAWEQGKKDAEAYSKAVKSLADDKSKLRISKLTP